MHEIQEKATTHKVFMKIIRPWPGRSGYLEKFSDSQAGCVLYIQHKIAKTMEADERKCRNEKYV